jgi:hypothetical protein
MTKRKTLEGLTKAELDEEIASQQSLKTYVKDAKGVDKAARALEVFQKLAPDAQADHLRWLEQSLRSHKDGDGAPDASKRNKDSLRPDGGIHSGDNKMPKLRKETEALMKEVFDTPELQQKALDLFTETAKGKAADVIASLFDENTLYSLMFCEEDDPIIEAIEYYANRIDELESGISELIQENAWMKEAAEAEALHEERLYVMAASNNSRRRSSRNLSEDFEADPDNAFLLEDGERHHVGGPMAARVAYLNNTTRNVDQHKPTPIEGLLEVWELQNK